MQVWTQAVLPGFLVPLPRKARGRKPPLPRWTFTLDPAGERLVWMEKHDTERFAELPEVVRKAAGWYGLARLAWLTERDRIEQWEQSA